MTEEAAARTVGVERHAAEVAAAARWGCRSGEPAARRRTCSRRRAARGCCGPRGRWCRTASRSRGGTTAQVVVEVLRPPSAPVEVAQEEPLAREVLDQRLGLRVRQHPRAPAARASPGSGSRPVAARSSSSSSGMLLHRKNESRDASARSLMRRRVARRRPPAAPRCGEEGRRHQDPRQRVLEAQLEVACFTALPIEGHQRVDLRGRGRTAGRRAGPGSTRCAARRPAPRRPSRPAHEDASRLGVSPMPVGLNGPGWSASAPRRRWQIPRRCGGRRRCRPHRRPAGGRRAPSLWCGAPPHPLPELPGFVTFSCSPSSVMSMEEPPRRPRDPRRGSTARTPRPAETCAKPACRRACRAAGLRRACRAPVARRRVGGLRRRHRAVADRPAADLQRRRHVALHQRGRNRQGLGDVVEAFARVVARQQRARVDVAPADRGSHWRTRCGSAAETRACEGRPGGFARSSRASRAVVNASIVVASGRGMPLGGIMPVRSLRTTFSHTSTSEPTCVRPSASSDRPPVFARGLWQVTQYFERKPGRASGAAEGYRPHARAPARAWSAFARPQRGRCHDHEAERRSG